MITEVSSGKITPAKTGSGLRISIAAVYRKFAGLQVRRYGCRVARIAQLTGGAAGGANGCQGEPPSARRSSISG